MFSCVTLLALPMMADAFGFDFFSRTNGGNVTLPRSASSAAELGWLLSERSDGSPCRSGLGYEYTEGGTEHSRERPLSLFFNGKGQLSALSVRAWFQSSNSYNPDTWREPTFGAETDATSVERWVTVSTRDPAAACTGAGTGAGAEEDAVGKDGEVGVLGDRLVANADGADGGADSVRIPTSAPEDPDGQWKKGACMPNMSQHWGMPLDGNTDTLLGLDHGVHVMPINPMYSVPEGPGKGRVTALAFFTTEPQVTRSDGGVWDASGTAAQLCGGNYCVDADQCEYGASNSVLHIFFIDQWTDPAQCGDIGTPGC